LLVKWPKSNHPNVFIQISSIEHYSKNDEEKDAFLIELLIQWIITDQQAFLVIENADFCVFIAALDQWFQLPTIQTISESILDLSKRNALYFFLATMQNKFAITTDI